MANLCHPAAGLLELDAVLCGVHPGDWIVWQVESPV
jgi:hypothetical protein